MMDNSFENTTLLFTCLTQFSKSISDVNLYLNPRKI